MEKAFLTDDCKSDREDSQLLTVRNLPRRTGESYHLVGHKGLPLILVWTLVEKPSFDNNLV